MNAPLLPRFLLRLALPLLALAAMIALADPLPQPAPAPLAQVSAELRSTAEAVRSEAGRVSHESQQAAERARSSAAAMRWLITLPAASGRRCLVDTCAE